MLAKTWSKENTHPLLFGVQMCTATMPINVAFLKKMKINLPQDPTIPLLGINSKDAASCHRDTYSTMFIAALFILSKNCKQLQCPSIEEWIKEMWVHLYNGVLFSC